MLKKALSQSWFVVGAVAIGFFAVAHEADVHSWVARAGPWGPLLAILLYTVLASIPFISSGDMAVLNGMLFGFWWGYQLLPTSVPDVAKRTFL